MGRLPDINFWRERGKLSFDYSRSDGALRWYYRIKGENLRWLGPGIVPPNVPWFNSGTVPRQIQEQGEKRLKNTLQII
jgi:hypothetical protein